MSTFAINENTESNVLDKIDTDRTLLGMFSELRVRSHDALYHWLKFLLSYVLDTGNFAVRFTAYISVPQAGHYTFYLTSNDGSALYIHGTKVVDNDGQVSQVIRCSFSDMDVKWSTLFVYTVSITAKKPKAKSILLRARTRQRSSSFTSELLFV